MTTSIVNTSTGTSASTDAAPSARRVAWLLNHTTLRESEVPLIRSLGYEVFTSKQLPFGELSVSASADYSDDQHLTLPKNVLDTLNAHNFYHDVMTSEVKSLLNAHFDTVICAAVVPLIDTITRHFAGRILVRAFGRELDQTYSQYFKSDGGRRLWSRIATIQDRFWLAACYPSIPLIEDELLKSRSVVLPVGLPERILSRRGQNVGSDPRLLFVCPRINLSPEYYGKIYSDFKKDFGDLDYLVAGNQPKPVTGDPRVAGYVDATTYDQWYREFRVMYYHSREKQHIHYHPLEAIAYGMPVVFLRGGLMEEFGGSDQPGACNSPGEARRKIQLILRGDQRLIDEIRKAQPRILQYFSEASCRAQWESVFTGNVMKSEIAPARTGVHDVPRERSRPRRIAVMLSAPNRGGLLRSAKDMAKIIHTSAKRRGEPVQVIFSCLGKHYDLARDFGDLTDMGIPIRDTRWEPIARDQLENSAAISDRWLMGELTHDHYAQPFDGARQFADCDLWILVSERLEWPIVPAAQVCVVAFDYIQRYVPEIFEPEGWPYQKQGYIPLVRGADFVACTTPSTANDLNAYAGVPKRKIVQLPMFFEGMSEEPSPRFIADDYFVWITNPTMHKNHERALHAALRYYQSYQGTLKMLMVGPGTNVFERQAGRTESPYWAKIRAMIQQHHDLRQNIHIAGELSESRYLSALKHARFLFHPNLNDNGTFSVIDAAWVGTPSLSARYPAMEFMNDTFKLNLTFFDPFDEKEMAVGLRDMQERAQAIALPDRTFLESFSWRNNADFIYDQIMARVNV